MSKTYIAHLPERYIEKRPDDEEWLQMPVNVSGNELMIKTLIPLTPCTDMVSKDEVDKIYDEARDRGYKEGQARGYQEGLYDAWEAARKIVLSEADGGIQWKLKEQWFGKFTIYDIFKDVPAMEAIEKIRQYEQEQEEIKVGDEVNDKGGKGIITRISDDGDHFNVMWENGSTGYYMMEDFKKTGRHFPEIAEVLKKIKEETA